MKSKILIRGDHVSIYTSSYLPIQSYLANIVSNPKLSLSEEQKKTFQEVLNETTQQFAKEAAKTSAQAMQNSQIWKSIGAVGMNSTAFSDLLMSGNYSNFSGSSYNTQYNLTNAFNPISFDSSNYLSNFYNTQNKNKYSYNTNLYNFYSNLNNIKNKF